MKVYIPFNMIVDVDFGIIRLIEKVQNLPECSVNKLKSILLRRKEENPIIEYNRVTKSGISDFIYDLILSKFYDNVIELSTTTDLLPFIINTYKIGVSNEIEIIVGYDFESEKKYFTKILSQLDFTVNMELNTNINLNDFSYIFIKYLDDYYVDHLIDTVKISGKQLYIADYRFNTIYHEETNTNIIDPMLHMRLESEGNVLSTISLYNKK